MPKISVLTLHKNKAEALESAYNCSDQVNYDRNLIIPSSYQSTLLHQHHDHPAAGHLGADKTAARIRQVVYWGTC